jgi:glycosyltransferase involved in cell wall biosynthesis
VPTVASQLAAGLAARGHEVAVLAPSESRRGGTGNTGGARVYYSGSAPWPGYPGLRFAAPSAAAVRALAGRFRPDVVHAHSPLGLGLSALRAARRLGVPVVYTHHYLPANALPGPLRPAAFDRAFWAAITAFARRCTLVTAPTTTALALLTSNGMAVPGQVISNGIDTARFSPGPADPALAARYGLPAGVPVIVSVGRLSPEKRAGDLIEALARLRVPAVLVLAGSGPSRGALERAARSAGVAGRVLFPGFVPDADLAGLYRAADVFATASQAELQGIAALQALACGLPVAAPAAGALPELVQPGVTGALFAPGDSAGAADCLESLMDGPPARYRAAARAAAAGHDLARCLTRWEHAYAGLARDPRRPR